MSRRAVGGVLWDSKGSPRRIRRDTLGLLLPLAVAGLSALTLLGSGPAVAGAALAAPANHRASTGATATTTTPTTTEANGTTTTVAGRHSASAKAPASTTTTSEPRGGEGQNLLAGDQATFSGTTGGWIGGSATLAWVASPASTPNGSLSITSTTSAQPAASSGSPQNGSASPATPGALYKGTADLQSAGTTLEVEPAVVFYGSSGTVLTAVFGQQTPAVQGTWTSLVPVLAIAPPSTTSVTFVVIISSSTSGQTVYLEDPSLTGAAAVGSPAVHGPLTTSGNQITQADGSPFVAQGVLLPGLQSTASPTGLTENTVLQAKTWGANLIRVPLGEQLWLSSSCAYSPAYSAEVSKVVNWITSLGMVALLELSFSNPADIGGGSGSSCPAAGPHVMADQAAVTFWSQVAAAFASNPLVAFDLYNEPQNIPPSVWLNGGAVGTYQAAGMQALYDAVRSAGAHNLAVVSGNNWANSPPPQYLTGSNIAYAVHVYTCGASAPPNCSNASPYDPSPILDKWIAPSASVPVMVSEFGWPSLYDGTYNAAVIAFAKAHGWGWIDFAWTTTGPWGLLATTPVSGPYQPSPSGMPALASMDGLSWP